MPRLSNRKKVLLTVLSIVLSILLLTGITGYLIVKSYINKIHLTNYIEEVAGTNITDSREEKPAELPKEIMQKESNAELPDADIGKINSLEEQIKKNMEDNSTPIKNDKNVFNLLLIGSDTRNIGHTGRSDAMILISINKKTKEIIATSLLRDIYLKIPGYGNNRLNAAYACGGAVLLMDTIEQNFKIQIDRYASTNFYTFIDLIDQIDGIEMEITEEEIPIMNTYIQELNQLTEQEEGEDILIKTGMQHLDGKQALSYIRNRYIGTDFVRTKKQRAVLKEAFKKIMQLNLIELNELFNHMLPQITTNLTEGEIFSLILGLPSYGKYDIKQWGIPVRDSYSDLRIRGMEVLSIDFKSNIKQIQKIIYAEE